jgi:hypothetical protein
MRRVFLLSVVGLLLVVFGFPAADASGPGIARASPETDEPSAGELTGNELYEAQIRANEAAADRWRAEQGGGDDFVVNLVANQDQLPLMGDCPDGTVLWNRDDGFAFCALVCVTDDDCIEEEARCRLIDPATVPAAPLFIDELLEDELSDALVGTDPASPPSLVCDPFFDGQW